MPFQDDDKQNSLQAIIAAMNDNKQVEDTERSANKTKMWAGLAEGLGDMAAAHAGFRKPDYGGAFDAARKSQDQRIADAKVAQRQRVDNLVTADKIQQMGIDRDWQGKQRTRQENEWQRNDDQRAREDDPDSLESSTSRELAKKLFPQHANLFEGKTHSQLKGVVPGLEKAYELETSRIKAHKEGTAGRKGTWRVDPRTGELGFYPYDGTTPPSVPTTTQSSLSETPQPADPNAAPGLSDDQKIFQSMNPAERKVLDGINRSLGSNKIYTKQQEVRGAAQDIRNLADIASNGGKIDKQLFQAKMARLGGEVGALSEGDKKGFGGEAGIQSRINRFLDTAWDGTMLPEDVAFIKQITNAYDKSAAARMSVIENAHTQSLSKQSRLTPDQAKRMIRSYSQSAAAAPAPEAAPQTPANDSDIEAKIKISMERSPGATREDIIRAGQAAGKIPKDYK